MIDATTEGRLRILTIDRVEKANALTREMLTELADAVEAANAVAAVVVGRRGADPPRRHELPADWSS